MLVIILIVYKRKIHVPLSSNQALLSKKLAILFCFLMSKYFKLVSVVQSVALRQPKVSVLTVMYIRRDLKRLTDSAMHAQCGVN